MAVAAQASVTISWNTVQPSPAPAQRIAAAGTVRTGVVLGVHGTRVVVRLTDGTVHIFTAPADQARILQGLVGRQIQFASPR